MKPSRQRKRKRFTAEAQSTQRFRGSEVDWMPVFTGMTRLETGSAFHLRSHEVQSDATAFCLDSRLRGNDETAATAETKITAACAGMTEL